MNHIYRVVFNTHLGIWQVVSELGKSRKKTKSSSNRNSSLKPLALTIGLFATGGNQLLYAADLPQGGQVTAGSASISTNANTMTVTQDTPKAAINWQSFDIGKENTVNFKQPDSSAVILNRVVGNEKSVIDGALNANGQVYLLNSNGVLFSKNASVNVGGLVASTNNISDKDFMEGKTTFEANGSKGKIINLGTITAKEGGYVALLGNHVTNEGVITAKLGAAVMASGDKVSLNFNGNSVVGVTVDEGTLKALVENKHAIIAENGLVVMTAKGLDKVMAGVVNNSGEIQASSIVEKGGKIYLSGDEITNSGKIVADGAKGGGEVLVGGDWQGANEEQHPHATEVTLTQTSEISASATKEGDGGKVVAWSGVDKADSVTKVDGKIAAEGKGKNAKGGKIETSGKKLDIAEKTDIKTNGGEWLLDPVDITIDSTLATAVSGALDSNNDVTITTAGNNTPSTASGESGTNGDITVNSAISWTSDKDLTLHADRNIKINADISATDSAAKLTLNYGQGSPAAGNAADYNIARNVKVNLKDGQNFSTKLGNDGTAVDYTVISGAPALMGMTTNNTAVKYALGANLDLMGITWTPLYNFRGKLSGLGHVVDNLSTASWGVFERVNGGEIRDIGVTNVNIVSSTTSTGKTSVGALVGDALGGLIIKNAYSTGNITGYDYIGGLVGGAKETTISDSYSSVTVNGNSRVGGLVGYIDSSTIKNSYASGNVSGDSELGGLIGKTINSGSDNTINNVYALGNVTASAADTSKYAGGLVGSITTGATTIDQAYATGAVSGTGGTSNTVGGLIGYVGTSGGATLSMSKSFWDTTTSGQAYSIGDTTLTLGAVANANAYTQSTYTQTNYDLDFTNTWFMVDGYTRPFLRMEATNTITNAHELQLMSSNLSGSYKLANDINLHPSFINKSEMWKDNAANVNFVIGSWVPVGTNANPFAGSFDGQQHIIDGILIFRTASTDTYDIGLFGSASGDIKNIGLNGFIQITQTASDKSLSRIGLLVGQLSGNMQNSYAHGIINLSSVNADTDVNMAIGGLIGEINYSGGSIPTVSRVYADVGVDTTLGDSHFATVGGLVGNAQGVISESYATGSVKGYSKVGGFAGKTGQVGNISKSYASGAVTGSNGEIGGLVGENLGIIDNSYSTGDVSTLGSGGNYGAVGGLVGSNSGDKISNSYTTSTITTSWTNNPSDYYSGTGNVVGAFAGADWGYWDNAQSLQLQGIASNNFYDSSKNSGLAGIAFFYDTNFDADNGIQTVIANAAVGKTTAQMKDISTFSGTTPAWEIVTDASLTDVYPKLRWTTTGLNAGTSVWVIGAPGDTAVTYTLTDILSGRTYNGSEITLNSLWTTADIFDGTTYDNWVHGTDYEFKFNNGTVTGFTNAGTYSNIEIDILKSGFTEATSGNTAGSLKIDKAPLTITANEFLSSSSAVPTEVSESGCVAVGGCISNLNLANNTLTLDFTGSGELPSNYTSTVVVPATANSNLEVNRDLDWNGFNLTLKSDQNINIKGNLTAGGATDKLTLEYGQGAAAANNTATYDFGLTSAGFTGKANLQAGQNFTTKLGSDGAAVDYTVINDATALQNMNNNLSGKYALGSNVDLSSITNFVPVGNDTGTNQFTGKFDGLGHTVDKLTTNQPVFVGLFGFSIGATIGNVGIVGGNVSGSMFVGSLVGRNRQGTVTNAYSTIPITGTSSGGLVGVNDGGIITNTFATGSVGASNGSNGTVGGLVGSNESGGTITNSYATGSVNGSNNVGGLIGVNQNSTVSNSYATGAVSGTQNFLGGLIGDSSISTTQITNTYSTGTVTGAVNSTYVGGLIGRISSGTTINNSYWDTQTSGLTISAGGVGKTTTEMYDILTYRGTDSANPVWNIAATNINNPYPSLGWTVGGATTVWVMPYKEGLDTAYENFLQTGGTLANPTTPAGTLSFSNGEMTFAKADLTTAGYLSSDFRNSPDLSTIPVSIRIYANTGDFNVDQSFSWNGFNLKLDAPQNININADITGSGASDKLTLNYGQGAVAAGNTSTYYFNGGHINLNAGQNFDTKLGNDGAVKQWTVITSLGTQDDATTTPTTMTLQGITSSSASLNQNYVLGSNIDASATSTWNSDGNGGYYGFKPIGIGSGTNTSASSVAGYTFYGSFDGLGHTIDSLYVNATTSYYAGLFGVTWDAKISNVGLTNASINSSSNSGALVGYARTTNISDVYSSGRVEAYDRAGGIVGFGYGGKVSNSYSLANTIADWAGGIAGYLSTSATVSNSHASGLVDGTAYKGGLVARVGAGSTVTDSFWDTDTTGQTTSAGGGTGITNANAYTQLNYANFDFINHWFMVDGYTRPFLRMEATNVITNAHELQLMSMKLANNYKLLNDINLQPSLTNKSEMWKDNSASVDFANYNGSFAPVGHNIDSLNSAFFGGLEVQVMQLII